MEQGLASQMAYGSGKDQNTTHYYAKPILMKGKKMACKPKTTKPPKK